MNRKEFIGTAVMAGIGTFLYSNSTSVTEGLGKDKVIVTTENANGVKGPYLIQHNYKGYEIEGEFEWRNTLN